MTTSGVAGPLMFSRYAFMPNLLGYCGAGDNNALFQYTVEGVVDGGLLELERQFEGAYPYLQLIALANQIPDPLDARVVEAYWLGNELLDHIDLGLLYRSIEARFKGRMSRREFPWLASKLPLGARPHHSFHVMEVYPRAGTMKGGVVDHLFETMDRCRVSWGRVLEARDADLLVETEPLTLQNGGLFLGAPVERLIRRKHDGHGFVDRAVPGDWVSIHWDWACDVLTPRQVANLRRYSGLHLRLATRTV